LAILAHLGGSKIDFAILLLAKLRSAYYREWFWKSERFFWPCRFLKRRGRGGPPQVVDEWVEGEPLPGRLPQEPMPLRPPIQNISRLLSLGTESSLRKTRTFFGTIQPSEVDCHKKHKKKKK